MTEYKPMQDILSKMNHILQKLKENNRNIDKLLKSLNDSKGLEIKRGTNEARKEIEPVKKAMKKFLDIKKREEDLLKPYIPIKKPKFD